MFGATYCVLAPEHRLVEASTTSDRRRAAVEAYRREGPARKSDLARTDLVKEKTGVATGAYARNPVNGQAIPIWTADYVLMSYGTRRHHGRSGRRPARLGVRQAVRHPDY